MTENTVLEEADFEKFRQYCRTRGLDLCYFCPEISGSKEEITCHKFDSPKVIKLRKRRFSFEGIPYDVAEWQQGLQLLRPGFLRANPDASRGVLALNFRG